MALESFVTLNNLVLSPLGFPHLEHQDPYACLGEVRGRITRKECLRWCLPHSRSTYVDVLCPGPSYRKKMPESDPETGQVTSGRPRGREP